MKRLLTAAESAKLCIGGDNFNDFTSRYYDFESQNFDFESHNYDFESHNYDFKSHYYDFKSHNYEIVGGVFLISCGRNRLP